MHESKSRCRTQKLIAFTKIEDRKKLNVANNLIKNVLNKHVKWFSKKKCFIILYAVSFPSARFIKIMYSHILFLGLWYAFKRGKNNKNNKNETDMKINIRMYALVYHDPMLMVVGCLLICLPQIHWVLFIFEFNWQLRGHKCDVRTNLSSWLVLCSVRVCGFILHFRRIRWVQFK